MPTVNPPSITALPAAPNPNDRSTFNTRAYPWSAALPTLSAEISAVAANVKANADDAVSSATAAAGNAVIAAGAVATSGALLWVSGTTYAIGNLVYSPADFANYRRKTSGAGTTDPSLDPTNWAPVTKSGLVLLAALTPTVAANVDFLTVFSGAYDDYLIQYDGLKAATSFGGLGMKFAIAGVASSASTYYNPTIGGTASTGWTECRLTGGDIVSASLGGASGTVHVKNVNSTGSDKMALSHGAHIKSATEYMSTAHSHTFTTAGVLTGVRFMWESAANFQAVGKIRIYGYINA